MERVWALRDDPESLDRLHARPRLSPVFGLDEVAGLRGPVIASPEWWEGINAYTEAIEGEIAEIDIDAGTFTVRDDTGEVHRFFIRGDRDDFIPGFRIHVLQSFPPPGYLPESGRSDIAKLFFAERGKDVPTGLILEIWMEE
jgi:hypothetical protein